MAIIGIDGRYINDQYHGIGRVIFNLCEALGRLAPSHTWKVYYNPRLPNTRFDLNRLDALPNIDLVPTSIPYLWPHEQLLWAIHLRRVRLDAWWASYFNAPLLSPVPTFATIYDLLFDRYPQYMPQRYARQYYRWMMRLMTRRVNGIFAPSKATGEDLIQYYPAARGKIHILHFGIDSAFHPRYSEERKAEVRARYHLPERFILTVGARRPHKNLATLVEALARIQDAVPHALVMAGPADPRFPDVALERAQALGIGHRVVTPGFIAEEDLPVLYATAEVFAQPSIIEGFGLPVPEAMACGTPVLASDIPVFREIVGEAALLVPVGDSQAMADALYRLLSDPNTRAMYRERGLEMARRYTWDNSARQFLQALEGVIGA